MPGITTTMRRCLLLTMVLMLTSTLIATNTQASHAAEAWSTPVNLSPSSNFTKSNVSPDVAVDGDGHIHAVWIGNDENGSEEGLVWYSVNSGSGWSTPFLVTDEYCQSPQIALDPDGHPHIVWGQSVAEYSYETWYSEFNGSIWSVPRSLSAYAYEYPDPQIAVDGSGHVQVVWSGGTETYPSIWYLENTGSGWPASPTEVSTSPCSGYLQWRPQLGLDPSGNPHVVWEGRQSEYGNSEIFYNYFNGTAWGTPISISNVSYSQYSPSIIMDGDGDVHVVWSGMDSTDTEWETWYRSGHAATWGTVRQLSSNTETGDQGNPSIALDSSGNPYTVWEGRVLPENNSDIWYSSNPSGTWTTPVAISSPSDSDQYDPSIAVAPGGSIYVVWEEAGDILLSRNAGSAWSTPATISTGDNMVNEYPLIALGSAGNPFVLWQGGSYNTTWLWHSGFNGTGWSTPVKVSAFSTTGSVYNLDAQIAVDAFGARHAVWTGVDGNASRTWYSADLGTGWSTPAPLSNASAYDTHNPKIALDSAGNPHVVWYGYTDASGTAAVWYSELSGSGWSAPLVLSTNSEYYQRRPQIAIDPDDICHIVWSGQNSSGTQYNIWYVSGSGADWSSPLAISPSPCAEDQDDPQLALDPDGNPHVTWDGYDNGTYADSDLDNPRIWYANNLGSGWSTPQRLSSVPSYYEEYVPQIAVDSNGNPHVVWEGYTSSDLNHIMYSANLGEGWTEPVRLSTQSEEYQYGAQLALDTEGNSHVVWSGYDPVVDDRSILYSESSGASTWSAPQVISASPCSSSQNYPQIELDKNGNPKVAWNGYDDLDDYNYVWYSERLGTSWSTPRDLSVSPCSYGQYHAQIALDTDDNPHVAWNGYDSEYVYRIWESGYTSSSLTVNTSVAGGNGTVSPASSTVAYKESASITMIPDAGYTVESVVDNGVNIVPVPTGTYTIPDVMVNHDIVVTFGSGITPWYLAEGSTDGGMETFVLVQNPNSTPVIVNVDFMTGAGAVPGPQDQAVPPNSRVTFKANDYVTDYNVSTKVTPSGGEIICERSVYGNERTWAHDSIGVTVPMAEWYLAEGSTDGGMETFVLVQNPNNDPVDINVDFFTGTGPVAGPQGHTLAGNSRVTFKANDFVTDYNVSTRVTATGPVISERAVYGNERTWAHDSIGVTEPASTWYLAEGSTDGGMETFVLVQNPNDVEALVDLTFMTTTGTVAGPQDAAIGARSRVTFKANDYVTDYNVSTRVDGSIPVIAERSVYGNERAWAHDSIGTTTPRNLWYLAEGSTDGGMETFVLVQNPNDQEVLVDLTFMTGTGIIEGPGSVPIPANSRVTFKVNDYVTDYNVSTMVDSDLPVICERSMYGNDRTWAHDSIGYSPGE